MKRAFQGLRLRTGPDPEYDVVITGAGVGGLVCANLLARAGLKTLLVEQHYMVGGYCSTFKRKGYVFDAATHFYPLLGNPESITGRLLKDLGVPTEWVKMDPVDHFHFPDGSQFSVSADFDVYLAAIKTQFPEEAQRIDAFFADVRQTYLFGLLYYFRRRDLARMQTYHALTVGEVLDRHIRNRKLKLLLTADSPHWGSPPSRTSFVFDSMLRLSYFLGNYYPVGGSQGFVDDLAARFEAQGGHILMNSTVKRVLVNDGAATGVELETGPIHHRYEKTVQAKTVVSNADLRQTLEEMIPAEWQDTDRIASTRQLRPTYACFLTHIGLQGISTDVLTEAQGYYWDDWDPDLMARNGLVFKIFVPTLYEPRLAPPGGHVVIIQKVVEMDYDAISDWRGHKMGIETYIMERLERIIPGFSTYVVEQSSASAFTSYRFTLNYQGAMLGWEMSPDQLGPHRPDIFGPVKNMYCVGHWVKPGGGITPVIVSAMHVAHEITGAPVESADAATLSLG
ncbi:MAG: NAD(P)/FAD-dependent oxidoreductase [candidate division Zixibacteria bacterium]|nr:NAD(P)/FAD-dependent oxidoreductase [candidate division Zixibacteria bacterium]